MPPIADPEDSLAAQGDALSDYDYPLDDSRIALRPAVPRDSAKLLVAAPGSALADHRVADLPALLAPGDRLVVNDSKVIPAQLAGVRERDGHRANVRLTLIAQQGPLSWRAFGKPAKRIRAGDTLLFPAADGEISASVSARDGAAVDVTFARDPLVAGAMPLPPYIAARREADQQDETDYQTVYADPPGSVAAPTAGLHFSPALLDALRARGVGLTTVTLHVGAGTFLPVSADRIDDHVMHTEWGHVTETAVAEIRATKAAGGRVIAVGTTALRLLETAGAGGALTPFTGETDIFIRPGFRFQVADGLMTNFHLPRSTLLMLVAAFIGYGRMRDVYDHALAGDYRFYSYGDTSLLLR